MADDTPNQTVPWNPAPPQQQDQGLPFENLDYKPVPPVVAEDRASRATYGLQGKVDKNYPDYYDSFVGGQENAMRGYITNYLYQLDTQRREQNIVDAVNKKGSLLSSEELDAMNASYNNPQTVIEDHFAQRYMNTLKWPVWEKENSPEGINSTNWMQGAYTAMPNEVQKEIDLGAEYRAKTEFGKTREQDADAAAAKQSWLGFGLDMAKSLSGIYQILKAHPSGGSWSLLAGNMREEFVRKLWFMPYDQMQKEYDAYIATLNPSDAKQFAADFNSMSARQKVVENLFPFISVESIPIAGIAKGAATQLPWVQNAVRQQIFKTVDTKFPELSAAVNAGDMKEATVQKTWGTIVKRARRADPIADALEDMPYLFKLGRARLAKELEEYRGLGLELGGSQQLLDQYDQLIREFPQMIADMTRPERVPALAERYRPAIEAAQQQVIDDNRTLSSRIWNLSEPYWNPYTQNWWIDIILGKNSQEAFGTSGHAGRVAAEHGLSGFDITGDKITYAPESFEAEIAKIEKESGGPVSTPKPENIIWRSKTGGDLPVEILTEPPHRGSDGRLYQKVRYTDKDGTFENYVPLDEIVNKKSGMPYRGLGRAITPPENPVSKIVQGGSGFYIIKPVPVKETAPGMREYMAKLSSDRTPTGGVLNSFLSRLRTPNETLSEWMNKNRQAATFVSSRIEQYAYEQAEAIRKLAPSFGRLSMGKARWDDFERVLNNGREIRDPTTGKKGYTYQNVGELQYAYMKQLKRLPDDQEVAAYFAFKRIQEMDHALRVLDIIRNKYRNGVMDHKIFFMQDGAKQYSPSIDAIPQSAFPRGHTKDFIAIIDDDGKAKIKRIGSLGTANLDKYEWQISSGQQKVARIWSPTQNPLAGFGGIKDSDHIGWVMSKNMETAPLDWTRQLPWRGGGHFIPKWNQYLKQIIVKPFKVDGVTYYTATGTRTLMPVVNGVEGRAIMKHFNNLRELLSKSTPENLAAAKDLVENTLHMDWKEVYQMFRPIAKRGAKGRMVAGTEPMFNLTEPFQLINANENLMNIDRAGMESRYPEGRFTDATKHGDMSLQFATEYTQERDFDTLMTLWNDGSIEKPAYRWDAAPLLDAIPTMDRTMTRLANTTLMNDMKAHAVETWIQEAYNGLRAAGISDSELESSPLYWFHHGTIGKGWDPVRARDLETTRMQIKQFLGQVSETDAITHVWTQKLVDATYERFPKISRWLSDKGYDDVWAAHELSDPTRLIRSLTFHLKMGLFSIPQLLVQGQTYTNIFGIAGLTKASQGTTGALLMQFSRANSSREALLALDKIAQRVAGYRPGEWMELRQHALDSGFFRVGREYSLIDDPMSNRIFKTAWGNFLDFGAMPFTEGERHVRYGAWFTAGKEFRDTKPIGALTNADKLAILDRASLLNGNMNRASNALYQRGWAAFPTQFFTYTIRQAELMWGKRLTPMEKARLLVANATMYGLPVGLGITGLPSDVFRQNMIQNGYTPGENYAETLITEGVPSVIASLINGGTYYNIGERFGTTGATPVYDILYGDKAMWEMAMGASGSTLKSVWEAFDPFKQKILSTFRGDPSGFNIMPEHYVQIAKEASSFNNSWRAIVAAKTGQLLTKKGEVLSNKMDTFSSILMGLSGLQPQEATDFYLMSAAAKSEKDVQQWAEKRFIQEFHRGLEAYDNKDNSNGDAFMANALAYVNMFIPEEDRPKVLSAAAQNWETIIERVKESFGTKHVPPGLEDIRRDQYIKGLQLGNG